MMDNKFSKMKNCVIKLLSVKLIWSKQWKFLDSKSQCGLSPSLHVFYVVKLNGSGAAAETTLVKVWICNIQGVFHFKAGCCLLLSSLVLLLKNQIFLSLFPKWREGAKNMSRHLILLLKLGLRMKNLCPCRFWLAENTASASGVRQVQQNKLPRLTPFFKCQGLKVTEGNYSSKEPYVKTAVPF